MARQFHCQRCNLSFSRKWNWERHFDQVHSSPGVTFQCSFCTAKRKSKADMRQHLRMSHPERKAQVQADPSLIREIRVKDTPNHVISDTALDTPPAVAVRSVVHIPDPKKNGETPSSLCSPGFQLPVELQHLLDNNCQDVLQTAAAVASISSEVVPEQPSIVKLVAVPTNVQSARVHQEASEKNDLPPTVTHQRLVLPTDIDPNIPYIPERCAITTQTGLSSVEAVPKSPKYLAPTKISQRNISSNGKFKSCGTSMEESEQHQKMKQDTVVERSPSTRGETCPHGVKLPVYERVTSTTNEANSRKRTVSEKIYCIKCWRGSNQEEEDEESDWGF